MYTVSQIADWFIARSRAEVIIDDDAEPITKMKLQKLLYFAQGVNLAVYDERLFDGKLYAFQHGPVTRTVQNNYTGKDLPEFSDDISDERAENLADNFEKISADSTSVEVLDFVWSNYSGYTASMLRDLSHVPDGPWAAVYEQGQNWIPMDDEAIKKYFKDNVVDVDQSKA